MHIMHTLKKLSKNLKVMHIMCTLKKLTRLQSPVMMIKYFKHHGVLLGVLLLGWILNLHEMCMYY